MDSYQFDKHWATKIFVRNDLKNIKVKDVDWANASDPSSKYNCFGFAIGVLKWWQPKQIRGGKNLTPSHHWPDGLEEDGSIESYIAAAGIEGFKECTQAEWDKSDAEKIVLYENDGKFTHAVKCISNSIWKSKFGGYSDFEHSPNGADWVRYGNGRKYLIKGSNPPTADTSIARASATA